ncbi:MAG: glutamate synthase domain-containing protein 2 [Chlamydiales bacterium]|jgi:glutamate synthase domain-containing protein 2
MSIGVETHAEEWSGGSTSEADFLEQIADWEDILRLLVNPEHPSVNQRPRKARFLSFLLERAAIDESSFWRLSRSQRGRLFLSHYSRLSRDIPGLEITSFDVDKVTKERFRQEPLTLGAAWHYGFWRSYFSHAAITHPANDGLREEFSTAWDIVRRKPAVLFREASGVRLEGIRSIRLDLPMLVGPLPYSDGHTLELAYLMAGEDARAAGEELDSLVVVGLDALLEHFQAYLPYSAWVLPRFSERHLTALGAADRHVEELLHRVQIVEFEWCDALPACIERLRRSHPDLLISTVVRHGDDFWEHLERAARTDGVALIQIQAGSEKSYRLIPKVDEFLKKRFLRARVQLVNVGGDTDTQASAASVYESILLGANAGAMTHIACLALAPELVEVYHGASAQDFIAGLARLDQTELTRLAKNSLSCWKHSILDFLSCMGIDDIKKTSGNTMAITMTEDWMREVDSLVTPEFADINRELNAQRIEKEPVPRSVREKFRVSSLMTELKPDTPGTHAAALMAQESASWHLMNTNRNLTADFLEVIYRMSAGDMPRVDDFFLHGDMGMGSIDEVGLRISRESLAWSLERLEREPAILDYISMATPRGFHRPGTVAADVTVELRQQGVAEPLASLRSDNEGGFDLRLDIEAPPGGALLQLWYEDAEHGSEHQVELLERGHGGHGRSVLRASADGSVSLKRDPRGGLRLSGTGIRQLLWAAPVSHASISLGAASEDFLKSRIEGNKGLAFTSSGEGGPIRIDTENAMQWQSLQAASGHFGIHAGDLRQVRDVEIKINQGAKPGKGGRLTGAKVTEKVSRARNIPVGTNALSPDPKHDIYSIEDMPAEVWLWLLFHTYCGIKITGSNYTKFVAAGMWSNFVVDYLLIDSGLGGSGNYHADSSHVGWPDIMRTILHTHHALVHERVDRHGTGKLESIRDDNGQAFGAQGGTRLLASGGLRSEIDIFKVLIAGADGVVEASIGKAVAFGCNQCGNCHLDCPRGGITTKAELTIQNDPALMARRLRNWTVLNMVKLAVMIDAVNRESGALDADGTVVKPDALIADIRSLRGRVDLLDMPSSEPPEKKPAAPDHDSCRVGSLTVSEPVSVHAIWEAARVSHNGGNNRGGGIDFAGFTPPALREATCLMFNTIGPDRVQTMRDMLQHLDGCRFLDARGRPLKKADVLMRLPEFRTPVREQYRGEDGWRRAGLRESVGNYYTFFVELRHEVLAEYGAVLLASEHWLQRRTKYGDMSDTDLHGVLSRNPDQVQRAADAASEESPAARDAAFLVDVRQEYFSALAHLFDTRYYRTHLPEGSVDEIPSGKYAAKRRGFLVSMGEDLGAIKISGWAQTIPEYFDFDHFWAGYPGVNAGEGVEMVLRGQPCKVPALLANVWGLHHRYPTNSPAIDAEGRGNPAGAHPFKAYNLLLMHNGEQVAVDSTAPFLCEYGYVHSHGSMGAGAKDYEGDSLYERKALTDTEYAAYLVDFTRRVLGLTTEEASQIISPITGIDLEAMDEERRDKLKLLMENYVQLTPTGPYKFTIVESVRRTGQRVVGFRENMDIKFLRPHEIVSHRDLSAGGPEAVANGSEAKIADAMLRILHQQGVLKDSAADLRFNMRQGGKPGLEEHGGVFEASVTRRQLDLHLVNRFGEIVPVRRAGFRADMGKLELVQRRADLEWMEIVDGLLERVRRAISSAPASDQRWYGPEDGLPSVANELVQTALDHIHDISFDDYRYLAEVALPRLAQTGDAERALALRVLTELRKRLAFTNTGDKALSSVEYITSGGRDSDGGAEGGIYRLLDAVPRISEAYAASAMLRIDAGTRDDLVEPVHPMRDVLVIDMADFESESFTLECCSKFLTQCVRYGWRHIVAYDARGGPRYQGTNLPDADGAPAQGVMLELYGHEHGDFLGALLEGARIYAYGQAQSHVGFKADSGYMFVLQDALNTCLYSAHGGTFSAWDSGSRFAVAGQNKVFLEDRKTLAPGLKSIHFGSPNEYAFEYLMSGGENSLHIVLGLKKPDQHGELSLKPKPYAGKFLMSGAAAGRVILFDPERRLAPEQHEGNERVSIPAEEWHEELAPFLTDEANRRGIPITIEGDLFQVRLEGTWRTWHYSEAFIKLVPAN